MAELTNLESKLGEVMGLAMAAQTATEKVRHLALDEEPGLIRELERMHNEAAETEERCSEIANSLEGKKTAIHGEAATTKRKGGEMLKTYMDNDSDVLDGFEFLTMAEAGEVGHWRVLSRMAQQADDRRIVDLCTWALPIQERHLSYVNQASERLATAEDPAAIS
jgi:hypothetical protein